MVRDIVDPLVVEFFFKFLGRKINKSLPELHRHVLVVLINRIDRLADIDAVALAHDLDQVVLQPGE